jgi:hypothetical protein
LDRHRSEWPQNCAVTSSDIALKLARHWGQSLSARVGASSEALREFESRHGVKLPTEMRDYLVQLDGTGTSWQDDKDAQLFSFWQLAQIRPVNEDLASYGMQPIAGLDRYFVFADFMDWSWAYAIKLDADSPGDNEVVMIGTEDGHPRRIAGSFGEFVDLYVDDSPRIYIRGNADRW